MSDKPWFENGLRFKCTQCGDCCTGAPGYVWVNNEEIAALAGRLSMPVADFEAKYVRPVGIRKSLVEFDNGDCVFLIDRKCTVYEHRPRQCKTWPFWESNIRSEKAWAQTCEACPGAGKGNLVTVDKILAQMSVIKI